MALIDTSEKIFIRQSNDRQFDELNRDTSAATSGAITPIATSEPLPTNFTLPLNNVPIWNDANAKVRVIIKDESFIDRLNDLSNRVTRLEAKKSLFSRLLSYLGVKSNE